MTTDVLKNEFSEFINYNGVLYMKDVTGKQSDYMINQITEKSIKGNETTYEIEKSKYEQFYNIKTKYNIKICKWNMCSFKCRIIRLKSLIFSLSISLRRIFL